MSLTHGEKTEILIEALPYIQQYEGTTFVVKYGGSAMTDEGLCETFAQDVTLLKKIGIRIVIVHGGGREITDMADRLGLATRFVGGHRYTDEPMMDVVQMVLSGKTNKDIVRRINTHGGSAVGISGIDADLLRVRRHRPDGEDLGLVGEVVSVNTDFLHLLADHGSMPVIAPVGVDEHGAVHNVNADTAAAAVGAFLRAEKLVYLSDVPGVLADGSLVHSLTRASAARLISGGAISNGMLPKIRSAFSALDAGVTKVHLIDGRVTHSILLEIFTREGLGTEIVHDSEEEAV
jgi:acetylglutamate kinase